MTRKDFKRYMCQGLGRCAVVLEHTKTPERYRDLVLYGALHNLSYDLQSEGSRALYIYRLIGYFPDRDYFLTPCLAAFERLPLRRTDTFVHFADLLSLFSKDGCREATYALLKRYAALWETLLKKRSSSAYDYERDCFEILCIALCRAGGEEVFFRIVSDLSRLFEENPYYQMEDFENFLYAVEESALSEMDGILSRLPKTTELASFQYAYSLYREKEKSAFMKSAEPKMPLTADMIKESVDLKGTLPVGVRVKFSRHASSGEKEKLAGYVIAEQDPDKKAKLLSVFIHHDENFPLSHRYLIEYAESSDEMLRKTAFSVLENCQSAEARDYARILFKEGREVERAIMMLLYNYEKEDKALLMEALGKVAADYKNSGHRHAIDMQIIHAEERGVLLDASILLYLYETTRCSACRKKAVILLCERRAFPQALLKECLYDSNEAIVSYAIEQIG